MQRRKGFTLIELMIVVAIVAILAAIAAPYIFGEQKPVNTITNQPTITQQDERVKVRCLDGFLVAIDERGASQVLDENEQPTRCNSEVTSE